MNRRVGNVRKGRSGMATQKNIGHELKVELKGFTTFKLALRANGKMALLKVGVQVNPLKRDYYDVLVFGPAAKHAGKYVDRGAIVKVEGALGSR